MSGKHTLTEKQKKVVAMAGIVVFVLLSAAVVWFAGRPMLAFVSQPEHFRAWVDQQGLWGPLAFVGMMVLQVFVAVIPGEPLEIVAGYAFGMWEGTLLCLVSTTIGGVLVFQFVRHFGVRAVEIFFPVEKIRSLRFLHESRRRNALVFLIFLIPGTPKDLLSYFVGLTDMRLRTWLVITSVARLPSIVTSTIGGDALGVKNYVFAIIMLAATLAVAGAGALIYRYICRRQQRKSGAPAETPAETDAPAASEAASAPARQEDGPAPQEAAGQALPESGKKGA